MQDTGFVNNLTTGSLLPLGLFIEKLILAIQRWCIGDGTTTRKILFEFTESALWTQAVASNGPVHLTSQLSRRCGSFDIRLLNHVVMFSRFLALPKAKAIKSHPTALARGDCSDITPQYTCALLEIFLRFGR